MSPEVPAYGPKRMAGIRSKLHEAETEIIGGTGQTLVNFLSDDAKPILNLIIKTEDLAPYVITLPPGHFIIGRKKDPDVHIQITSDKSISRLHADLVVHSDATVTLRDLGSGNGTWVDGQMVTDSVRLKNGDAFKIGRTGFMLIKR